MNEEIQVYTDGSWRRNELAAGAGVVIINKNNKIEVYQKHLGEMTNNAAELSAIKYALAILIASGMSGENITIYSDSKYSIGVLSKDWEIKSNTKLVDSILELKKEFDSISFKWVKGHSANRYNKLADLLANIAVDQYLNYKYPVNTKFIQK